MNNEAKATPRQIRMAQNLACELGHLNKGIESLWSFYKSAPALLEACREALNYLDGDIDNNKLDKVYNQLTQAIQQASK